VHLLSNYFIKKQLKDIRGGHRPWLCKRARTFAELLDAPLAIVEKRRQDNDDRAEVLNVIGEVKGKDRHSWSTMRSTRRGRSWRSPVPWSARVSPRSMPVPPMASCPAHPSSVSATSDLAEVVITDTIPLPPHKQLRKIRQLSVARSSGGHQPHPPRRISGCAVLVRDAAGQEMVLWSDREDDDPEDDVSLARHAPHGRPLTRTKWRYRHPDRQPDHGVLHE